MELWAAETVFDSGTGQDAYLSLEPIFRSTPSGTEKEMALIFAMRAALGLLILNEI